MVLWLGCKKKQSMSLLTQNHALSLPNRLQLKRSQALPLSVLFSFNHQFCGEGDSRSLARLMARKWRLWHAGSQATVLRSGNTRNDSWYISASSTLSSRVTVSGCYVWSSLFLPALSSLLPKYHGLKTKENIRFLDKKKRVAKTWASHYLVKLRIIHYKIVQQKLSRS